VSGGLTQKKRNMANLVRSFFFGWPSEST